MTEAKNRQHVSQCSSFANRERRTRTWREKRREEKKKHSRMRKNPQAIRRWKSAVIFVVSSPQTPVLIHLRSSHSVMILIRPRSSKGLGMTPKKTKGLPFFQMPKGVGCWEGDVVVGGDEERDPSDHNLVYACAEMGGEQGGKSKHRDSTHPVMSLAYCIALCPSRTPSSCFAPVKREHQSI